MKKTDITHFSLLVNGILLIIFGIIMLVKPQIAFGVILLSAKIVLAAAAVTALLSFVFGRERKFLEQGIGYVVTAVLIVFMPKIFAVSVSSLFGLTALMLSAAHAISAINFKKDNVPKWRMRAALSLISLAFGYLIFKNPLSSVITISKLSGIYLVFAGMTFLGDFLSDFLHTDFAKDNIKPRVYMPLPVFIAAMVPRKVLKKINSAISNSAEDIIKGYEYVPSENPRLEVYIHIGNDILGKLGHMDLCFDNVVYSYGCYDTSANKLGGFISDGTLAVCKRIPYMYQALDIEKKTLIGFAIDINDKEAEKLKLRIDGLRKVIYKWEPLAQRDSDNKGKYNDPASQLYKNAGSEFYKFRSGPFKTYFALGTNCVLLAHRLIGSAGAGILKVGGLVTPGTYFAYLDRLYNLKNTFVVERTVYRNGEKYEQAIDNSKLPK